MKGRHVSRAVHVRGAGHDRTSMGGVLRATVCRALHGMGTSTLVKVRCAGAIRCGAGGRTGKARGAGDDMCIIAISNCPMCCGGFHPMPGRGVRFSMERLGTRAPCVVLRGSRSNGRGNCHMVAAAGMGGRTMLPLGSASLRGLMLNGPRKGESSGPRMGGSNGSRGGWSTGPWGAVVVGGVIYTVLLSSYSLFTITRRVLACSIKGSGPTRSRSICVGVSRCNGIVRRCRIRCSVSPMGGGARRQARRIHSIRPSGSFGRAMGRLSTPHHMHCDNVIRANFKCGFRKCCDYLT